LRKFKIITLKFQEYIDMFLSDSNVYEMLRNIKVILVEKLE